MNFKVPEIKAKYLERFKRLAAHPDKPYHFPGSRILLEPVELGEIRSEAGLILTSAPNQTRGTFQSQLAHVGMVLLVGDDNKMEDGTEVQPGNIVLIPEYGIRSYTSFPGLAAYTDGDIQLSTVDQIHLLYKDVDAFAKAFEALNS